MGIQIFEISVADVTMTQSLLRELLRKHFEWLAPEKIGVNELISRNESPVQQFPPRKEQSPKAGPPPDLAYRITSMEDIVEQVISKMNASTNPGHLEPLWLVKRKELLKINEACEHYMAADEIVPFEWIAEVKEIVQWLHKHKKTVPYCTYLTATHIPAG